VIVCGMRNLRSQWVSLREMMKVLIHVRPRLLAVPVQVLFVFSAGRDGIFFDG
jgi:hypothetical protein